MDGGEHVVHERVVPCELVVCPRHELLAFLDVGGREVRGPDLRSEEDVPIDILRALRDWNVDLSATDIRGRNIAHIAASKGHLDILTELKAWHVDLDAEDNNSFTPLKIAVGKSALRTAQHLILLGARVRPADFPASHIGIRRQLMAWTDDHLARHRGFVYAVLTAIHDDGSHTAEGQTNWLARLQGQGTFARLRMHVAEYLGIRVGPEYVALVSAMAVWRTMPPVS